MADANDPTATVKRMFAAFGARDLDALLETVHPESRWTYVGANPELSRAEFMKRTGILGDLISWEDEVYGTSKSVFAGGA